MTKPRRMDELLAAFYNGDEEELGDEPRIFVYDNYPGGIGFSEPLFSMHDELLARTRELIGECPCTSGCPSCVGPEGAPKRRSPLPLDSVA